MLLEEAMKSSRDAKALLTTGEQEILYKLASEVPVGGTIVELGSWMGGSTIMLAAGSESGPKARVFAVDLFDVVGETSIEYADRVEGVPYFLPQFLENLRKAGIESLVNPVQSNSSEAGKNWKGGPIDLLFVDANHYYAAVREDYVAWAGHCRVGVRCVFHDYGNDGAPGVRKFVDRLIERGLLDDVQFVDSIAHGKITTNDPSKIAKALQFRASEVFKREKFRNNWFQFAVAHGWMAFRCGDRNQAVKFGVEAVRWKPWQSDGWRLLACVALNRRPQ